MVVRLRKHRLVQRSACWMVSIAEVISADLVSDHAQEMQGIGMSRIDLQNLAIEQLLAMVKLPPW